MRIALVLDRFQPRHGGLERWTYQLAEWLLRKDHVVHVVAIEFDYSVQDMPVVPHPVRARWRDNPLKRARRFADCIETLDVDLVHDTGSSWRYDVLQPQSGSRAAGFLHQLRNLRPSQRCREFLQLSNWYRHACFRLLERRQFAGQGHVVAVSNLVRDDLRRMYQIDDQRITLIHNGVDTRRFTPVPGANTRQNGLAEWAADRENTFLISANNFRLKGVDTALAALADLNRSDVAAHLAVMGRGDIDEYRRHARRLGVEDRVFFCGPVDDPENHYNACDVYLHPALYDACSLSVLEAMACGAPVITSRFNGSSELIRDGVQGLILEDPRSIRELTGTMRSLCDPDYRSVLKSRAREHVLQLDIDRNFSKIFDLYCEIAARKARAGAGV